MVLLLRDSRFTWRRTKKQELLLLAFAKGTCGSSSHRKDAMSMTWTITASFAYATSKSSSSLLSFEITLVFCSSLLYRIVFHTKSMVIAGKFDFRFWLEVCFLWWKNWFRGFDWKFWFSRLWPKYSILWFWRKKEFVVLAGWKFCVYDFGGKIQVHGFGKKFNFVILAKTFALAVVTGKNNFFFYFGSKFQFFFILSRKYNLRF